MDIITRQAKKPLKMALILLLLLSVVFLYMRHHGLPSSKEASKQNTPSQAETALHVAAMGDMLAHDTVVASARTSNGGYDFEKYFQKIRPLYTEADVVFCNQEGLSSGPAFGVSGYPAFNAPIEFAKALKDSAGCNLINLANNHMGDKGVAATNATIDLWNTLHPLAFSGANKNPEEQERVSYADVKGIKIGFVSFADFNNNTETPAYSINIYHDEELVRKLVSEARQRADVVLVSMHWGTEDSAEVNSDQQAQVKLLASLGVDVIIGTGPHVLQKVETVRRPDGGQMVVWYSLGNMLSSQLNIPELFSGIARFDVVKPVRGPVKIENLSFHPTYMHYEWSAQQKANNVLSARHDVMLYPLSDAAEPLSRSQLGTTVDTQRTYIIQTLGPDVSVK